MPIPSSDVDEEFEAQVAARKADGTTDEAFNGDITVELEEHDGAGVLSGTLTQAAVDGIATFDDLSIDVAGEDYRLSGDSSGFARVYSNYFDIIGGGGGLPEYFLDIPGGNTVVVYDEAVLESIPVGIPIRLVVTVSGDVEYLIWGSGFTAGSEFVLIIDTDIELQGKGGRGGSFKDTPFSGKSAGDGEDGGDALELSGNIVEITNMGFILGGGAGGGAGGAATSNITGGSSAITGLVYPMGAGAGRGWGSPVGGTAGNSVDSDKVRIFGFQAVVPFFTDISDTLTTVAVVAGSGTMTQIATDGGDGDTTAPGVAGIPSIITGDITATTGAGGDGGDWGEDGGNGAIGISLPATTNTPGGVGGTAGKAVSLSGGMAVFIAGDDPTHVKGDVA